MHINMNGTNDCFRYIDKLASVWTNFSPVKLIISASSGGYMNTDYLLDDIRHGGAGWAQYSDDYSAVGYQLWVSGVTNGLLASSVSQSSILFFDGIETISNTIPNNLTHPSTATNLAGYMSWGGHSSLGANYSVNGTLPWGTNCGWWIIETIESFNGFRVHSYALAGFLDWFSPNSFAGTNYNYYNPPVGAVSYPDEPGGPSNGAIYFGEWARGKVFALCAWNSRLTPHLQAVGDPFVAR